MLPLTNNVIQSNTEHFIVPENESVVAATKIIKRGRRPLSDEVKAARAQEKLEVIQVAKRAKIAKKKI